jgi:lambda family phage portal protein
MKTIDRIIGYFSPAAALQRARDRKALAYYEAAKPSQYRKGKTEPGSADAALARGGAIWNLRAQARFLDQNHDLSIGILNTLVQNTVGPHGIQIEPQPRRTDGSIHDDFARQILMLYRDWSRRPEVTWQYDWPSAQRIMARTLFRDGEAFAQRLIGPVSFLDHGTKIPYSLELLEPDFVPHDYDDDGRNVRMGIMRNDWHRPVAYYVYKTHPGDRMAFGGLTDLKAVPAERMLHLKHAHRIGQVRGASIFAGVMTRLDDVKDYEESERVAAKVAASMAAVIVKGSPDQYDPAMPEEDRMMTLKPGVIFDNLMPGESVSTIDTNRPNSGLEAYRRGQLRAVAAGTQVTYSSIARDYDGSYSSQRQELIEGYGAYGVLSGEIISQFIRPVYEDFIQSGLLSGLLVIPPGVDPQSVDDAVYIPPQAPWIDPLKEANAMSIMERSAFASGPEIIRRRGQNPRDVIEQEANWQRLLKEHGLKTEESMIEDEPEVQSGRSRTRLD